MSIQPARPNLLVRMKAASRALFGGWGGNYASGLGTYSGGSSFWSWPYAYPSSRRDWALEAGDLFRNSAIAVGIGWIHRGLPYAVPQVTRPATDERGNDTEETVKNHRLVKLLNRPNQFYTRATLLRGWSLDYCINGEAYLYIGKTSGGRPAELWPLPSYALRPQWTSDGTDYIDHYVYTVNGRKERFGLDEIVRFLFAPDPIVPRAGWTPLKQCLREVVSDNEIATFTASLLQNGDVMPGYFSPKVGAEVELDEPTVARLSAQLRKRTTGDERGKVPFFDFPLDYTETGLTPEKASLDKIARIPEARIFGALGLQAAAQGQAVGEGQRSYANLKEMREADAEGCLMPLWFDFADQAGPPLLALMGNPDTETLGWDFSRVRMLTEDTDAVHERARKNYSVGGITRGELREQLGEVPDPERDDVYFIPANGQIVPATAEAMQAREERSMQPPPAALAGPDSAGDAQAAGNGKTPVGAGANGNGKKP